MWYVGSFRTCTSMDLNILCLVFINIYCTFHMLKFTKMHEFYPVFTRTCSESNSSDDLHVDLVQIKFNMHTLCLDDHHRSFFCGWLTTQFNVLRLSWVQQSISMYFSQSPSMKFRYDTPSFAMLSTLNNPQDLYQEYLKATVAVLWEHR